MARDARKSRTGNRYLPDFMVGAKGKGARQRLSVLQSTKLKKFTLPGKKLRLRP